VPDVLSVAILVILACGLLLAAVGVHLLSAFREGIDLSPAASIAAWVAAGALLMGALLVWGGRLPTLESFVQPFDMIAWQGPVLPMILMAALAIPVGGQTDLKIEAGRKASWSCALVYLPALALTVAVLIQVLTPREGALSANWVTPLRFSIAVCAGLGVRALGQALRVIAEGPCCAEWPRELTYGLLTLLSGTAALVNLWQRGIVWGSTSHVMRGGLAGAWLVWTADWLAPRRHPRLRAVLTVVAALLLMVVAIREA
jgi:hypothetical protein